MGRIRASISDSTEKKNPRPHRRPRRRPTLRVLAPPGQTHGPDRTPVKEPPAKPGSLTVPKHAKVWRQRVAC
eukprot:2871472-Lingulodinium_polyedra.AAC.1